ncbi:MAG: alpha-ketoglutarate-dependent dioxygenase AlkB [Gammaproteobacteria bacterium]|nr:alpha-ketoglutarate-dependent dioxygenase AlkB [Gammaproteobacteria bacterium]MDE0252151.1 alpha-ketoglutarate-dependent dioxygenase AlkB [Gammaproteobacteria bacterium]MDE0402740.1 alpha-ketoglutarate-dependent dioxygenase AlkB [Gammaproteobacteria bacterium]
MVNNPSIDSLSRWKCGKPISLTMLDGCATYDPTFLLTEYADQVLKQALESIAWETRSIQLYGRTIAIPRLSAWFSESGSSYTYSGTTHVAKPMPTFVCDLKNLIELATNCSFNSVLVNLYRDGSDSVSWHADNEFELGPNITIASLSVGAVRDLRFKHRQVKEEQFSLQVEHGSLLMMYPPTQENWLHELPKRRQVTQPRVNFSFRKILR